MRWRSALPHEFRGGGVQGALPPAFFGGCIPLSPRRSSWGEPRTSTPRRKGFRRKRAQLSTLRDFSAGLRWGDQREPPPRPKPGGRAGVRCMHDEPGRSRPRPRPPTRPRPTQRAAVLQLNLCHSGIAGCFIGDDVMLKAWLFADDELALQRCSQDEESLGILRRIPFPENLDRRVGQLLTRPRRRPRTWLTGGKNSSGSGIVRLRPSR